MSKEIVQITDYSAEVLAKILQQYKDSPKLTGLINSDLLQADDLEQALLEIRDEFWLTPQGGEPDALGSQLDVLGDIFNEPRAARSDADYRAAIRSKAAQRTSATPDEIIEIVLAAFGGTEAEYNPEYSHTPAQYNLRTDATITQEQLEDISPGGVLGLLMGFLLDEADNFIVDEAGNRIIGIG